MPPQAKIVGYPNTSTSLWFSGPLSNSMLLCSQLLSGRIPPCDLFFFSSRTLTSPPSLQQKAPQKKKSPPSNEYPFSLFSFPSSKSNTFFPARAVSSSDNQYSLLSQICPPKISPNQPQKQLYSARIFSLSSAHPLQQRKHRLPNNGLQPFSKNFFTHVNLLFALWFHYLMS